MKQIRLGLKDNLDVSLYAEPDLSDEQMKKIREKLLKKSTLQKYTFFVVNLLSKENNNDII